MSILTPVHKTLLVTSFFAATAACGAADTGVESEDSELTAFRSSVDLRGQLALEAQTLRYAEDARPFESLAIDISRTPGKSEYVGYTFTGQKGDSILLAAQKTSQTVTRDTCDEVVRIWLLNSKNQVVKSGTKKCYAEPEVPGLQSRSDIMRYSLPKADTYKVVVAVLPSEAAYPSAPIRTQPWQWLHLDMFRSAKADLGGAGSRCQDGLDMLCQDSLRCERARCK